jgi:hypothetical protein
MNSSMAVGAGFVGRNTGGTRKTEKAKRGQTDRCLSHVEDSLDLSPSPLLKREVSGTLGHVRGNRRASGATKRVRQALSMT